MDIYCRVTPYGLVPLYDSDHDLKQRLRVGSTVRCRVSLPRNYRFHKKFFALVRLTFDNLPMPIAERWNVRSENDMLRRFKRDLGYFSSTLNEAGEREVESGAYRSRLWMKRNSSGSMTIVSTLCFTATSPASAVRTCSKK